MANFESTIEALEHQWMRAWIARDRKAMKALAARDFIFLLGSENAAILDRASWLEAAGTRLRCNRYRFGSIYARRHGAIGIFAAVMEVDLTIDDRPLPGPQWLVGIWRKTGLRRRWQLVEQIVSRADADDHPPAAIRAMQLWR